MKKMFMWAAAIFMGLAAIVYFPSVTSVISIVFVLVALPVEKLQNFWEAHGQRTLPPPSPPLWKRPCPKPRSRRHPRNPPRRRNPRQSPHRNLLQNPRRNLLQNPRRSLLPPRRRSPRPSPPQSQRRSRPQRLSPLPRPASSRAGPGPSAARAASPMRSPETSPAPRTGWTAGRAITFPRIADPWPGPGISGRGPFRTL